MQNQHRQLVEEAGAIEPGHFVFVSGVHSETYMNKTAAFVRPSHSLVHALAIVRYFQAYNIEALVAPELGAIPFMADIGMAFWFEYGVDVARIMATKIPGTNPPRFTISRSQGRFLRGKRVLVIEDVFTKGGSAKSTVKAARKAGGIVVGVAGLWNRGGRASAKTLGVPAFFPLIDEHLPDYPPNRCKQCRDRVPVSTHLGKGKDFLKTARAKELGLKAAPRKKAA